MKKIKNYKLSFFCAYHEHKFEKLTNIFLIISVGVSLASLYVDKIESIVFIIILITTIIHLIARCFHLLERRYLK